MAPKPGRSSIGVRVRPNANDFIKDLERQLAGKKQTFWVNVRADMKPANRDIAEWAKGPLKKIRASIPVGANMFPATTQLADWRRKQAGNKTNIPIGLNLGAAYSQLITFRKVAGADIEVKLKVNTETANKAAERFEQALARRGINVPFGIEVDGTQVERAVSKAQKVAKEKPVKSALEVEVDEQKARLTRLRIEQLAKNLGVKIDVDADTGRARLQLKALQARAAASKLEMKVDVKRSGFDAFNKALSSVEKRLGGGSVIRSLDFGPLNLGKPSGLLGTLTTINLLAGAVPGAVFAITGLSKAITDLAGAASIAPGAIGGLLASISTFSVGVSGMGDAFSALTDMWSETGSEAASTARRSVQAHNQLRQATRDEAQAQRDVASARREATNDLRNLNNELRGGVLNEAQALLDLQKAKDRYAQGNFDNATDERQAALDILKAQDSVGNVRERNLQLQQKANDEGAKGVEGSDKVTQAQERVTRAAEATAQALEAIQSAQATGVMGKFQDEINQLTPNARDFVNVLAGMRGPFLELRNDVQETMFEGAAPAFEGFLNNLLPVVGPGMHRIAAAMNQSLLQVFDSLGGPQGQSIIDRILGGTAEAQEGITKLIDPLVRGLGTFMAAGAEHLPQIVDLFTRLADRFANFIETADKNGSLDAFMDRGVDALGKMAELGINLIQIINNLGGAFKGDMLQGLVDLTQKFEDWIVSAEGQQKINQWIQDAKDLWNDWKPVLQDLPEIFDAVSSAAKTLIDAITPFLKFFTDVMKDAGPLVKGFVEVWLGSKLITGFLSPVASLLGGILKGFRALPGLAAAAADAASGLPAAFGGAPAAGPGSVVGPAALAVAAPAAVGGYVASLAADAGVGGAGQLAAGSTAAALTFTPGVALLPVLMNDPKFALNTFGSATDIVKQKLLDKIWEKFEQGGKKDEDAQKIYGAGANGQMTREELENLARALAPSFMAGGYTDWGSKSGRPIIAHGGEYIEPKPAVDHYGVDALRAVHNRQAVIAYEGGGMVPMAYPGNDEKGYAGSFTPSIGGGLSPYSPRAGMSPGRWGSGRLGGWRSPFWNREPKDPRGPKGKGRGDGITGYAAGGWVPNMDWVPTPAAMIPVQGGRGNINPYLRLDTSTTSIGMAHAFRDRWGHRARDVRESPFPPGEQPGTPGYEFPNGRPGDLIGGRLRADVFPDRLPPITTGPRNGAFAGFEGGGQTVWDPNTNSWVPADTPISHGQNTSGAVQGPGVVDSVANNLTQGLSGVLNNLTPAGPDVPGSPGYTGTTGTAPGVANTAVTNSQTNPFLSGILGNLGIPGLDGSNDPNQGPGWGEGGPPIGLGGGDGFDIRRFGIGPGPVGSGPNDWQKKSGEVVGKFGAGLVGAFSTGLLGFFGLEGILGSPYFAGATGLASHFLNPDQGDSKVQGPGADLTNQQVTDLMNTNLGMPTNPTDASAPTNIPNVFDPSTGSAVNGNGPGNAGLQTNTLRGKAIIQKLFPWATNIGGVRPDHFKWHPNGLALDVMTDPDHDLNDPPSPQGLAKGNQLYRWLDAHRAELGIDYLMWGPITGDKDHYNHIHVNFAESGFGPGTVPVNISAPTGKGKGKLTGPGGAPPKQLVKPKKAPSGGLFGPAIGGSLPLGVKPPPPPRPSLPPRPPDVIRMKPQPKPLPAPAPPPSPQPGYGVGVVPPGQPVAPSGPPLPGPPPPTTPGVDGMPVPPTVMPAQIGTGPGVGAGEEHLHPAAQKGITSGFAAAGNIAGSMMGAAGIPGGSFIAGAFGQAGKIVEGIANVGAAFLVGNVTNGTTENPYGVTQRGSNPTGGTRISDRSTHYHGDLVTQNMDDFFRRQDLREKQDAQASFAGYDRYA